LARTSKYRPNSALDFLVMSVKKNAFSNASRSRFQFFKVARYSGGIGKV